MKLGGVGVDIFLKLTELLLNVGVNVPSLFNGVNQLVLDFQVSLLVVGLYFLKSVVKQSLVLLVEVDELPNVFIQPLFHLLYPLLVVFSGLSLVEPRDSPEINAQINFVCHLFVDLHNVCEDCPVVV